MNKKIISTSLVILGVLISTTWAMADVPKGYYNTLVGKRDKNLKDAIQTLIAQHTVHSYNSLWYYFYETDMKPGTNGQVWDMYSAETYFFGTRGNAVNGMNKEHSFPKSWWGGTKVDAYTDLNHLMPSDASANTAKSNWPLGEVYSTSFNNGVTKVGTAFSGQGGGATKVFEPADEYKGDFARVYFYMVTIYQDYNWVTTWMVNNNDWKTLNQWSIDLLLKWAREDPVSEKEINRNDAVFRCQNNRNPFIDDPLLCEYIWGNRSGQDYTLDHSGTVNPDPEPVDEPTIITPTQGTILDFGEVKMGESTSRTLYVKGTSLTSNLTLQLYRYDYRMFSIPTTSIDYTQVCTESGYPLVVTYSPTALGEHKAKLLLTGGGMVGSIGIDIKARCVERPADELITGDLNGDNKVDVSDVNIIINIILKTEPNNGLLNEAEPDINGDGVIDVADVNAVINIVLNHE